MKSVSNCRNDVVNMFLHLILKCLSFELLGLITKKIKLYGIKKRHVIGFLAGKRCTLFWAGLES